MASSGRDGASGCQGASRLWYVFTIWKLSVTEELLEEFHVIIHCPQCGTLAEAWLLDAPRIDPASPHTPIDLDLDVDCETCGNTFSVTVRAYADEWDTFLTDDNSQKGTFEHFDYQPDKEPFPEPGSYGIFLEALEEWRFNVTDQGGAMVKAAETGCFHYALFDCGGLPVRHDYWSSVGGYHSPAAHVEARWSQGNGRKLGNYPRQTEHRPRLGEDHAAGNVLPQSHHCERDHQGGFRQANPAD